MRIALVHDYLITYGGAERVLEVLHEMYPEAPLYTAFVNEKGMGKEWERFKDWKIRESWFSRVPLHSKMASPMRFLTPYIWESFDFDDYDVVISSSAWYNPKGILTRPETLHISYVHTPPRYLYGYASSRPFMRYGLVRLYAKLINKGLREYDYLSAQRPDVLVANSSEVQKRIENFYERESTIIYPPVEVESMVIDSQPSEREYYLAGGRLVGYKNFDIIIEAANELKLPLKIYGDGPLRERLKSMAGETVEFLGRVSDTKLNRLYAGARAFIAAAKDEDFGITPVEAQAHGVPVIAYKGGGYVDSVIDEKTGVFFDEVNSDSLTRAWRDFDEGAIAKITSKDCVENASHFGKERFMREMNELVELEYKRVLER